MVLAPDVNLLISHKQGYPCRWSCSTPPLAPVKLRANASPFHLTCQTQYHVSRLITSEISWLGWNTVEAVETRLKFFQPSAVEINRAVDSAASTAFQPREKPSKERISIIWSDQSMMSSSASWGQQSGREDCI